MRIPLAEHIRFQHAVIFAVVIFVAQQIEGTEIVFSVLCATFICLTCLAFNAARGFIYPSGAFIFFNGLLTAILGFTYKIFLNEPGESNLKEPNVTMLAYCGSMAVFGLLALIVRRIAPRKGLLAGMSTGESMKKAAIGSFIIGAIFMLLAYGPHEEGSVLSAFQQLNNFTQMAILLATFYQVKKTGGRQSSNWIVWVAALSSVILGGFLGFSKTGFLTGPVCWLVGAIAAGHNFSRKQLIGIAATAVFFQMFLVPYSQVGRNSRGPEATFAGDLKVAGQFLGNLIGTRDTYQVESLAEAEKSSNRDTMHFYDEPQGFFDRLNMLAADDALISFTDQGNYVGLFPTYVALINVIPHFIWKSKPFFYTGNEYAREMGFIASDNESTGISFSPIADAYHQAGWYGLLLLAAVILFLFIIMDGLSGDVRLAPWGLLFTVISSHAASEGLLVGQIHVATDMALGVVLIAMLSKYVLPVFARVITNSERTRVVRAQVFVPLTRQQPRTPPPQPTQSPTAP